MSSNSQANGISVSLPEPQDVPLPEESSLEHESLNGEELDFLSDDEYIQQEPLVTITGQPVTATTSMANLNSMGDLQQIFMSGPVVTVSFGHYAKKAGRTVYVASQERVLKCSAAALAYHSKYFEAAFRSGMKEAASMSIKFAGNIVRPESFVLLYNMALTGGMPVQLRQVPDIDSLVLLSSAYHAAAYLRMDEIQVWVQKFMTTVIEHLRQTWTQDYAVAVAAQSMLTGGAMSPLMVAQQKKVEDLIKVLDIAMQTEPDARPIPTDVFVDLILGSSPYVLLADSLSSASEQATKALFRTHLIQSHRYMRNGH